MQLKLDKRFWVVITCIIVVFTIFIVGRNLLHAIEIRKDIAILEQERGDLSRSDRAGQYAARRAQVRR